MIKFNYVYLTVSRSFKFLNLNRVDDNRNEKKKINFVTIKKHFFQQKNFKLVLKK